MTNTMTETATTTAITAATAAPATMRQKTEVSAKLIDDIIAFEWQLFDQVQGIGGRSGCQDDLETFTIMRKSQFMVWPNNLLLSYADDIAQAVQQHRNPISEKYAYMMEYSSPMEFRRIEHMLPGIHPKKRLLIKEITKQMVAWQNSVSHAYPNLAGKSRNLTSADDRPDNVSFASYLYGELATYSYATLMLYKEFIQKLRDEQINPCLEILQNTVKMYGYASLAAAEIGLMQK